MKAASAEVAVHNFSKILANFGLQFFFCAKSGSFLFQMHHFCCCKALNEQEAGVCFSTTQALLQLVSRPTVKIHQSVIHGPLMFIFSW